MRRFVFSLLPTLATLALGVCASENGKLLRSVWSEAGGSPDGLRESEDYPDYPSKTELIGSFEAPTDVADGYGQLLRGYVHPPATGDYTFWIASDDGSELWLSSSEDPKSKQKIAFVREWTGPREWTRFPEQKSQPVKLEAGKKYYIEAIHGEGGGGDNLAVGWTLPDNKEERPIPGNRLSSFDAPKPGPRTPKPPTPMPTAHGHTKHKFETTVNGEKLKMAYSLYLPVGYEKTTDKKPMLVFLHGAGECGTDCNAIFIHGPDSHLRGDPKFKDTYPFIGLSPQCPPGRRWDSPNQIAAVAELVKEVTQKLRVDSDRVYATGLSMGGKATWLLAHHAPELFAAIAPISAVDVEAEKAKERFKNMAIWIIAGGNDGGFTEGSKKMGEALRGSTSEVKLTVVPDEGHGVWGRYYPGQELYQWFLTKKRNTGTSNAPSKPVESEKKTGAAVIPAAPNDKSASTPPASAPVVANKNEVKINAEPGAVAAPLSISKSLEGALPIAVPVTLSLSVLLLVSSGFFLFGKPVQA
jgi:dienelactone hydrolase